MWKSGMLLLKVDIKIPVIAMLVSMQEPSNSIIHLSINLRKQPIPRSLKREHGGNWVARAPMYHNSIQELEYNRRVLPEHTHKDNDSSLFLMY